MLYYRFAFSPFGTLTLVSDGTFLTEVRLPSDRGRPVPNAAEGDPSGILRRTADWLERYFAGQAADPAVLPLAPEQTPFRRALRRQLCAIPSGQVTTYGALARAVAEELGGRPSAQAVGQALGRNPLPILVPCHRVVGADGRLAGYSGGLALKRQLLQLEGVPLTADGRIADFSARLRLP